MKSKGRWVITTVVALAVVGIVLVCIYLVRVRLYQDKIKSIQFEQINLADVPDGSYKGQYDADIIGAKVAVTVKDGKIIDIQLTEHKNERGASAEAVIPEIINEQRVDVDAVTGATNSSKVIEKAVEDALKNQRK
ncbi:FMN-binding protein [Acetanaerobacterium elongatum]|uniref:Uncharacterized protein, contains FMN-binding domain n=1 Tax=Acetanaerobacterium elongatum TaxID=258515 RepID=A0A1G9TZ15_9FIRM|nr:FMN-binding protein [Acetanaerobacterium elongatum]SDM52505.1 Uncharacterized protein, contains FMN-binding domain [Acetanaerobacterium elongatum]